MTWDPDAGEPMPLSEERRISACQGKSVFTRWSDAHRVARRMTRREHDSGTGLRFEPYKCPAGHIHIGSRDVITNHNPRTRRGRGKRQKGHHDE